MMTIGLQTMSSTQRGTEEELARSWRQEREQKIDCEPGSQERQT